MQGMNRTYTHLVQELLEDFPCVVILGPRQCGKTTLLQQLGKGWTIHDLERQSDFETISRDPDLFFRLNPRQVALDEAQVYPDIFKSLRVAIDTHRGEAGRFIVTGSSSPQLLRHASESLAGRVAMMEMAPFSYAEVHELSSSPMYAWLSEGGKPDIGQLLKSEARTSLQQAHEYWFQGGYPEPWTKAKPTFWKRWRENYLQTYIQRDIAYLFPRLDRVRFQQLVRMLGSLTGTILNYSEIARLLGISQPVARDYLEILDGTYLWRSLPAFSKDAGKRMVKHPKGYLRDTGLAHHLLRIPKLEDLLSHPVMGHSWESMVTEEILRNLASLGIQAESSHYRTSGGAEIDLVLEGDFGILPIEIKYTQKITGRQLQGMSNFLADFNCPLGIVINNDLRPRQYTDNIIGIPFCCL